MAEEEEFKLPPTFSQNAGKVKIDKGTLDGDIQLYSWDAVADCHLDCPAYDACEYELAKDPERTLKCAVESKYLKAVSIMLFKNFGGDLTEADFFRIGMHLLPLYKTLCKLKIYEFGVEEVIYEDNKGHKKADPVYKEIRDTIRTLEGMWKSLGLNKIDGAPPLNPAEPRFGITADSDDDDGDEIITMGDLSPEDVKKARAAQKKKKPINRRRRH